MKIIINGKTAILRKGTSFKFVSENCSVMLRSISVFIIGDILNLLHAVSRSITGCFVTQNIGEVARSDGGVENNISSVCLYRFSLPCPVALRGVAEQYRGDTEGTIVSEERDSKRSHSFLIVLIEPEQFTLP